MSARISDAPYRMEMITHIHLYHTLRNGAAYPAFKVISAFFSVAIAQTIKGTIFQPQLMINKSIQHCFDH
ncbi:hypothetical protein [Pacificitalea manganoxidans]|uniref:hypothetical protein n=1 Tax=Pacificitalea manganoxidans TaxID=1411902 RepID=UPI001E294F2F|nr:hypothetical protein [Pacificitalea manganoxidans]MDR6309513.1 hypothetical protein [Pacificitalea manganoxidans]